MKKFFHGTMNASKSAQLLMQAYNFERQGKTYLIFKPKSDSRDGEYVKSRAVSAKRLSIQVDRHQQGFMYGLALEHEPSFIFVDELQFFTAKQIEELADITIGLNIPIFAYGLLLSYTGELFEGSKRAIECGFTLHELKMQCDDCHEKSTHHLLYLDGELMKAGDGFHVGDTEYKSVCYACYQYTMLSDDLDK